MALPLPPYGWVRRDEPERTVFIEFDFTPVWPLTTLWLGGMLLGSPSIRASLVLWATWTLLVAALACLRGFRLTIGPQRFVFWRTWLFLPYRRKTLPLGASVEAVGAFGYAPDRVVIERSLHSHDVELGAASTCEALSEDIRAARKRWMSS